MSASTTGAPTADLYAINLAKTEYREGYERGDVDQVMSVFDEAFFDMSSAGPSFWGIEASQVMRARLASLFRLYTVKLVVLIIDVEFYGDRAMDYGWHIMTMYP